CYSRSLHRLVSRIDPAPAHARPPPQVLGLVLGQPLHLTPLARVRFLACGLPQPVNVRFNDPVKHESPPRDEGSKPQSYTCFHWVRLAQAETISPDWPPRRPWLDLREGPRSAAAGLREVRHGKFREFKGLGKDQVTASSADS